jgi:hypothetical protein
MAQSSASTIPEYQPYGAIRERSNSLDPASFLRRRSYDYTRQLADQSYGHRANVAGWEAGNRAAGAGITGGARESLINTALAGVGNQRAQEMGQLGAGYNATEAQGIQNDQSNALQAQSIKQQMMQAAMSYAASGRGVTNEGLANTIAAIQRGDPNAFDWLISRGLAGGGVNVRSEDVQNFGRRIGF